MYITKASADDLQKILQIYSNARDFMKKTGNKDQWKNHYPPKELLEADIKKGNLYVVKTKEDSVCGVFAFIIGSEPTYAKITQGQWLSSTEYGTLHRVAGDGTVHGIFHAMVTFCSNQISHLRIDTHNDNKVMQHLILKNDFQECGIIYLSDGSPRIAYERL